LDVEPKNQVELDKLFDDEQGFKDALAGVYIQMKQSDAYGARLTQTTIENLTSSWDVTSGTVEQKLGLFSYTDEQVDDALSAILSKQYAILASTNAILNNIEQKKGVFKTRGLYELVKGECLGIRAYVHLDIMRLFGPIPSDPTQGSQLAYVTEFSTSLHQRVSFEVYQSLLLRDIQDAEALLKSVDPVLDYSLAELRNPNPNSGEGFRPKDAFFSFRALRMNYYAVKALSARANLWFGHDEDAYVAAKEVIDAKNEDNSVKFRLGTAADFTAGDYVLREEQIFGLYDRSMYDWYQSRYTSGTVKKGTTVTTIVNTLFGNTGKDIRESSLWSLITLSNGTRAHIIRKYETKEISQVTVNTDYKQIPMLRSSEMYLILAETAPFSEGVDYFQQFKEARGLDSPAPESAEALQMEIIKEYRKEFYAEGQSFFAYKRNNVEKAQLIFVPSAATVNYVLPLPSVEEMNVL
jgi:hypothetical protein